MNTYSTLSRRRADARWDLIQYLSEVFVGYFAPEIPTFRDRAHKRSRIVIAIAAVCRFGVSRDFGFELEGEREGGRGHAMYIAPKVKRLLEHAAQCVKRERKREGGGRMDRV